MLYYFRCCQRRHKKKRVSESFSASEKIDTQDTDDSWSPKNEDDLDAGFRDSEVCQGEQGTSTPSAQTSSETAVSQYSLVSDVHLSHVDLLQACQSFREPAYPLPAADVITHPIPQGLPAEETLVCPHTAENARGAVIFLPGVHGGVGPGRTPGCNFDENAIFPTIATMLRVEGISSYRISWKYMMPSLQQATGATFAAYLHYKPSRIVLVGHSLGGAVAYLAAKMLHQGGVDVVGVCACEGAEESMAIFWWCDVKEADTNLIFLPRDEVLLLRNFRAPLMLWQTYRWRNYLFTALMMWYSQYDVASNYMPLLQSPNISMLCTARSMIFFVISILWNPLYVISSGAVFKKKKSRRARSMPFFFSYRVPPGYTS